MAIEKKEIKFNDDIEDAQKRLAKEIRDDDPRYAIITNDDYDRLDSIFWRFRKQYQWYGAACSSMRRILTRSPSVPTAGVGWLDGQIVLAINIDWFFSLTLPQQMTVLCHEIDHVIREHPNVMKQWPELAKRLNFCMDAIINTDLEITYNLSAKDFPQAPGGEVNMITFEHFVDVVKNRQPNDPKLRGKKWNDSVTKSQFVYDAVSEKLLPFLPKEEKDDGDGNTKTIEMEMEAWHGESEMFDDGTLDPDLQENVIEQIVDEATKEAGSAPGHLQKHIDKIKDKSNRDWRKLIRGVGYSTKIAINTSWGHINKKLPFLRPGKYIFTRPRVLCVIDRSGSVGPSETQEFIKELNGMVNQIDLDMIFVDAQWDPNNPETYVKGVSNVKDVWKGWKNMGGGTNFNDVYRFLDNEGNGLYESIIWLTDGFLFTTPRVAKRYGKQQNVAILTPYYDEQYKKEAMALGYQVCIIDDKDRNSQKSIRDEL